jgi:PAS domain S-box-containing protein
MLGKPVWMLIAPEQREISREAVRKKILEEQPLAPFYRMYARPDGTTVTVEIHEKLIRDQSNSVVGIRTALLDCTERRRANELLAKERNLLRTLMGWRRSSQSRAPP